MEYSLDTVKFTFRLMKEAEAHQISQWHYEPPYSFYDFRNDQDDLREFLDFNNRPDNKYFSVSDEFGSLAGFFEFGMQEYGIEIGLGLRPDLTGRGMGLSFVNAGLEFARVNFSPRIIRLKVASFNIRALLVYQRTGFREIGKVFVQNDLGKHEFVEMELRT